MWNTKNISVLKDLIQEAYEFTKKKEAGKTNIYAMHDWITAWEQVQIREPKSFDSVILHENIATELSQDIK